MLTISSVVFFDLFRDLILDLEIILLLKTSPRRYSRSEFLTLSVIFCLIDSGFNSSSAFLQ